MKIFYGIIYKATCLINNKIYIGLTTVSLSHRKSVHSRDSKRNSSKFYNAIRKYGFENFKFEEIDGANSLSDLNYKEWLWIHKFNSIKNGYNSKDGGDHAKMTEHTKKRLSEANKNRKCSNETRYNMSIGQKIRFKNQSHPRSGCRGVLSPRSKQVLCVNNGKIYESHRQAAIELNLNRAHIGAILKGKRKTTKGYIFTNI